jgi:hypothetical protein
MLSNLSIKRVFHPIGQGSFYTENFQISNENRELVVVYDCGSSRGAKFIKSYINEFFQKNQPIEAVFISHLHIDHINGLEFLLNHCSVKRVFLPLLTNEEKIQLLVSNSSSQQKNSFINDLIINPVDTVSTSERYVFLVQNVIPDDLDTDNVEFTDINIENLIPNQSNHNILEKNNKIRIFINWYLIPFNFQHSIKPTLLKVLEKEMACRIEDLGKMWQDPQKQKLIKNIYSRNLRAHEFNINSMTLYSGPEPNRSFSSCCYQGIDAINPNICLQNELCSFLLSKDCLIASQKALGCLYLGDYNAKKSSSWDKLEKFYKAYHNFIGTIQVPHHGSYKNYNKKLGRKGVHAVLSTGKNNYGHPDHRTVSHLKKNGCHLKKVTCDKTTKAEFKFWTFGLI